MITEDYVSFETAKLLKEKGFDEYGMYFYTLKDEGREGYKSNRKLREFAHNSDPTLKERAVSCPTLQMAIKWLREVHNCHICVQAFITTDGLQGYCPFYTKVGDVFMWQNALGDDYATTLTYEEACEAAIKYCLENLI